MWLVCSLNQSILTTKLQKIQCSVSKVFCLNETLRPKVGASGSLIRRKQKDNITKLNVAYWTLNCHARENGHPGLYVFDVLSGFPPAREWQRMLSSPLWRVGHSGTLCRNDCTAAIILRPAISFLRYKNTPSTTFNQPLTPIIYSFQSDISVVSFLLNLA